jgi:aspartate/methionine/tyrosine aminotransferase
VDSSDYILERFLDHGIAVVPGPAFGDERFARHVRLSFSAVDEPTLAAGLERMVSEVLSGETAPVG